MIKGMVWIPGGTFIMGDSTLHDDEKPAHPVWVDGFWMDSTEVTNAQFEVRRRYRIRHHRRTPAQARGHHGPASPGTPPPPKENLVAGSIVFRAPDSVSNMQDISQWWTWRKGADWRHPEGPDTTIDGKDNYPVVQVSYDDALAYAKWAGKRLPHRGRVGIRRPRWHGRRTLRLGRQTYRPRERHPAREYLAGHLPHHRHRQGPLQGPRPREILSCKWIRPLMTWPATSGNGARTGTASTPTPSSIPQRSPSIPPARKTASTPTNPTLPSASPAADPFLQRILLLRLPPSRPHENTPDSSTNHIGFRCVRNQLLVLRRRRALRLHALRRLVADFLQLFFNSGFSSMRLATALPSSMPASGCPSGSALPRSPDPTWPDESRSFQIPPRARETPRKNRPPRGRPRRNALRPEFAPQYCLCRCRVRGAGQLNS